jgi:hypothetical protein
MIVSRAKLNDGYTEWQINSTMPITIQLFYVPKDGVSEQDPEIQELREEVEMLHEMLDKILLNG